MKAVILAGGLGTRLSEETTVKPKPMVEIGSMPIIWHIMKGYSTYGVKEFIILCGYKSHIIKEFFCNYAMRTSSLRVHTKNSSIEYLDSELEDWDITLLETGAETNTGGRLLHAKKYLADETFFFTYGDGVSNVNFSELLEFHKQQNTLVTLSAVQPPGRFGALTLTDDQTQVTQFQEKPIGDGAWINGGFFCVEPEAITYIDNADTAWEGEPLKTLAKEGKLAAYRHHGFWQSMDTLRDKEALETIWHTGHAAWNTWHDIT